MRAWIVTVVALAALSLAAPARADKAAAEAAFLEGKRLDADGKLAEACEAYAASYKADPALGALLNLGDCHDRLGRTATAWAEFHEAEELAAKLGDARTTYARDRAAALEPRLVRLRIELQPNPPPGLVIRRDGEEMTGRTAIPVDPGDHVITATAPGYVTWTATIPVHGDGLIVPVSIPILGLLAVPPAITILPTTEPRTSFEIDDHAQLRRHRIASVLLTGGVLGLGGALGFGIAAIAKVETKGDLCDGALVCTPAGAANLEDAKNRARIADIFAIAGGALLVTGLVIFVTAPSARRIDHGVTIAPSIAPGSVGATVVGRF